MAWLKAFAAVLALPVMAWLAIQLPGPTTIYAIFGTWAILLWLLFRGSQSVTPNRHD